MRVCRRGLHEIPAGKRECPVCKKQRDDIHRANYELAGKRAARDREWQHARYHTDPDFREWKNERSRLYYHEHRAPAQRLGIRVAAYRDMTA